jgi:SAM-dependent methyltransferase
MPSASDDIVSLYDRNVVAWDRMRSRKLFERAWLEKFVALLPVGGTILDIGCGTAEPMARFLIDAGYRLTGVDSSPNMIEACRRRFPLRDWLVMDMRNLSLPDRFDGLVAWDSFFHLTPDDQRNMFAIFDVHAAPHAALMFTSGPRHGEAIGTFQGEPLYHGSLDPDEYRRLLQANGFEIVAHVAEDPECGAHTVWLARRRR